MGKWPRDSAMRKELRRKTRKMKRYWYAMRQNTVRTAARAKAAEHRPQKPQH